MVEITHPKNINNTNSKWCNKGQHWVGVQNFNKYSRSKDGLSSRCCDCKKKFRQESAEKIKQANQKYWWENREKLLENKRKSWHENKEQNLKRQKAYYNANKQILLEQQKQYRIKNKDTIRQKKAKNFQKLYAKHRDRVLQQGRESYARNIVKERARNREYARKHPEQTHKRRVAVGNFTIRQWRDKIAYFGNCCYLCGESLEGKQIHIEHRKPISRGGTNWIANIAPACAKCNLSKRTKTEKEFREWMKQGKNSNY